VADWFDQQVAGVNQQGQQQGMPQVATAPDGVPVYSQGGQYFTKNADGSMTQQYQGGAPDWLMQQTGGGQQAGGQMPAGIDPHLAQLYQQYGITPGGSGSGLGDWQYWQGQALNNANGDWSYITGRLGSDLAGQGPDTGGKGAGGGTGTIANPTVPQAGQNFQNAQQQGPYQAPGAYTPQTITQPGAVTPQQVTPQPTAAPGTITPQTVQGPQALQAQTLANPTGFQAPTQADLQNNPQFQYAQQQAMQQLVNSGAAAGVARGSNTWKALQDQAANLAGQQYQQVYNNALQGYQTNTTNTLNYNQANQGNLAQAYGLTNQYQQQAALANQGANLQAQSANVGNQMQAGQFNAGQNLQGQLANQSAGLNAGQFNAGMNFNTQQANQANAASAYGLNAQTGLNAYQANVSNALGQGQLGLGYQQGANSLALGQGQLGLGYANYGLNQNAQNYGQAANTFQLNQGANQQAYNQNYSLAQLGLAANGQMAQAGQNYGNQATNAYEGIGNAQAAGSQQQGTNWGNALGGAVNTGAQLWALGQLGQPQTGGAGFINPNQPQTGQASWTPGGNAQPSGDPWQTMNQ
jgi:hypothetical protein